MGQILYGIWICTFLSWMVHFCKWDRYIVGFVRLVYSPVRKPQLNTTESRYNTVTILQNIWSWSGETYEDAVMLVHVIPFCIHFWQMSTILKLSHEAWKRMSITGKGNDLLYIYIYIILASNLRYWWSRTADKIQQSSKDYFPSKDFIALHVCAKSWCSGEIKPLTNVTLACVVDKAHMLNFDSVLIKSLLIDGVACIGSRNAVVSITTRHRLSISHQGRDKIAIGLQVIFSKCILK